MSDLHIPTPCHEDWDAMTPAGDGRHCATCNHQVIDIAAMPVAEGRRVLREVATTLINGGKRTCVRAQVTPAGRLVAGRRKLLTTALAGILACTMAGCIGEGPDLIGSQTKPPAVHDPATGAIVQPTPLTGTPRPRPQHPRAITGEVMVTKGDVCIEPIKGKIVQPPAPKPEPKPEDGITVGTVSVNDGDRVPPTAPVDEPRAR